MQSAPLTEHATKEEKVQALTQYDQRWELHGEHKPTEGGGRVPGLIWLRRGTQYTWHARGRQEGDLPPVVIEITFFFFQHRSALSIVRHLMCVGLPVYFDSPAQAIYPVLVLESRWPIVFLQLYDSVLHEYKQGAISECLGPPLPPGN